VSLVQERFNLLFRLAEKRFAPGFHHYRSDTAGCRVTDEITLSRPERNKDSIILILPLRGLPLLVKEADNSKRDSFDPDYLADRIGGAEKIIGNSLSKQADLGCTVTILLLDTPSTDNPPLPDAEEVRRRPQNGGRPVHIAVNDKCRISGCRRREF